MSRDSKTPESAKLGREISSIWNRITSPTKGKPPSRRILVNLDPPKNAPAPRYPMNFVETSKYTLLTFLPKNIFEQFHGISNFYFLILVVLQAFPLFQEVSLMVTATPIIVILSLTAIKDGFEDLKRHASDDMLNRSPVYLLGNWKNRNFPEVKESSKLAKLSSFLCFPVRKIGKGMARTYRKLLQMMNLRRASLSYPYPATLSAADYIIDYQHTGTIPEVTDMELQHQWHLSRWRDIRGIFH